MHVLVAPGGIHGLDAIWLLLAVVADVSSYGAASTAEAGDASSRPDPDPGAGIGCLSPRLSLDPHLAGVTRDSGSGGTLCPHPPTAETD